MFCAFVYVGIGSAPVPDTTAALPLRATSLASIESSLVVPTYDRASVRASIVHLGVGGFHRAHLATYIEELCTQGNTLWGIVGCGVLPGDSVMAEALGAQDTLYTLIIRGTDNTEVQVIGSLIKYVHASPDATAAIDQISDSATQIVSLTVTEGGYPVNDLTGDYQPDSPNAGPTSAFGIIAQALDQRRRINGAPITILSCDNIMSNGHVAQTATLGEAQRFGKDLIDWIATSVSFPNSMVDRITPATTDTDRAWLAREHGIEDRWPVVTEPFRQWVVEDNFAGERPPLEHLDIIVTGDVEPYEFMKLRLLNASHSCLAYLAALDGIETVDAAMAEPPIARYVRAFLDLEATPVLPPVDGIDVNAYNDTLIERFSNPAIGDQIARLCLDGSAKFPKFLLPTVRAQLKARGSVGLSALALAGWCQYLIGTDDRGRAIKHSPDPQLQEAVRYATLSITEPAAFLKYAAVFGDDLATSEPFRNAFSTAIERIRHGGIRSAIELAINELENLGGTPTN